MEKNGITGQKNSGAYTSKKRVTDGGGRHADVFNLTAVDRWLQRSTDRPTPRWLGSTSRALPDVRPSDDDDVYR